MRQIEASNQEDLSWVRLDVVQNALRTYTDDQPIEVGIYYEQENF
jgi:hypothetical protein